MEFTLKQQIFNFFIFFLFGIVLAIFLDFLKIIEFILHEKARHSSHNIRDMLFFTMSSLFSYLLTLALNNGELAFYIFVAEFLGWTTWHKTLSNYLITFLESITFKIKRVVINFYRKKLSKLVLNFKNKITKILKPLSKKLLSTLKKA